LGPQPNESIKVEQEYKRGGALIYLAAWDVHRAKIFGRMESKSGIVSFGRLVAQVMNQEPYRSASRVFLKFQKRYEEIARPFEWKFTRKDLKNLIDNISNQHLVLKKVA